VHLDAEGVGDFLQAGEVDAAVAVGLPALDLLLGDADAFGELALREFRRDAGFDQRVGQIVERSDLAAGYAAVAELLVVVHLRAQRFDLTDDRVMHDLGHTRVDVRGEILWVSRVVGEEALFEAGEPTFGDLVLTLVLDDHGSPVRSRAMMPLKDNRTVLSVHARQSLRLAPSGTANGR